MSCTIIEGYTLDCKNGSGGIKNFYLTELANVSSVTTTSGVTSAITMASGKKFWKIECRPETADFKYSGKISLENGTTYFESTWTFPLFKMNAKNRNIVDLFMQNRLVGIAEFVDQTNTGNILVGETRGGDVTINDGGSGKAMGDFNGSNITIVFKEPSAPTVYTGSLTSIT